MVAGVRNEKAAVALRELAGPGSRGRLHTLQLDVTDLRRENSHLKELVADLSLKNRVLKKSLSGTGEDLDDL